jgi:uncharacterized damage-inducible protein DinB
MPIPTEIANAAASFHINSDILDKSLADLTPEEWQTRPNETSNAMFWIAGHILWSRASAIGLLGSSWSKPWLGLFARGSKLLDKDQYPSPDELLLAWNEVKPTLTAALESASAETLAAPGPARIPSLDGKVSGVVGFLALHETYHAGQACYLRRWLGHGQVLG